jgi:hypothetical protein
VDAPPELLLQHLRVFLQSRYLRSYPSLASKRMRERQSGDQDPEKQHDPRELKRQNPPY